MKRGRKTAVRIMTVLALFLICGSVPAAANPKLSKKSLTLTAGKKATVKLANVKKKAVKWTSSNRAVVTVKKKNRAQAVITAKKKGKATVTATCNGKKYKCKVTVKAAAKKEKEKGKNGEDTKNTELTKDNVSAKEQLTHAWFEEYVPNYNPSTRKRLSESETVFGSKKPIEAYYEDGEQKGEFCILDGYDLGEGRKLCMIMFPASTLRWSIESVSGIKCLTWPVNGGTVLYFYLFKPSKNHKGATAAYEMGGPKYVHDITAKVPEGLTYSITQYNAGNGDSGDGLLSIRIRHLGETYYTCIYIRSFATEHLNTVFYINAYFKDMPFTVPCNTGPYEDLF